MTVVQHGDELEVLTLDAVERWQGVGTALLNAAIEIARSRGCRRLWLITTNDNVDALRFYQRRGLRLARIEPAPWTGPPDAQAGDPGGGLHGIPIRDELELELDLELDWAGARTQGP